MRSSERMFDATTVFVAKPQLCEALGQRLENGEKIGSILADRGGLDGEGGGTYLVDDDGNEVAMAAPDQVGELCIPVLPSPAWR